MKKVCFIIGNGTSRRDFDLEQLRGKGTLVGCNAIYREFTPDVLIAIDQKMLKEIAQSKYQGYYVIPHNRAKNYTSSDRIEFKAFNTSGAAAMQYAGNVEADLAFLIGFDCYKGNMYANTPNYNSGVRQFNGFVKGYVRAAKLCPRVKFINVIKDGKDGLKKEMSHLDSYLGSVDIEDFTEALSNFPSQEPLYSIDLKKET